MFYPCRERHVHFSQKGFHETDTHSFFLTLNLTLTLNLEYHTLLKKGDYLSKYSAYREKEDCSHF